MPAFPQALSLSPLKDKSNQRYLWIAIPLLIVEVIIFKFFYPYADFFSDSYSYIFAAAADLKVNLWPIGYSKFIQLFHHLSHSDTALVVFQYFLIQGATLYLLFTVFYYYQPGVLVQKTLFYLLMLNPLILYLSNYISSDGLFLALSLVWAAQLIQIQHKPTLILLLVHSLLIFYAFTVRYNAIYYPIISGIAYLLSSWKRSLKLLGFLLPIILVGMFISYTSEQTRKVTGTKQFSVFGGWQLANNAMYMLPHIRVDQVPPPACNEFHQLVLSFFEKKGPELKNIGPADGAVYLKGPKAPLKEYLAQKMGDRTDSSGGIASWGAVSPVYSAYGAFLAKSYPIPFARYFLLPNTFNYFVPPIEKLEIYNLGQTSVFPIATYWFDYPNDKVKVVSLHAQKAILFIFPALFGTLNLVFIWLLVSWYRDKKYKLEDIGFKKAIILVVLLILVNACFSILASPIVFRYMVFLMVVLLIFSALVVEKIEWKNN